MMPNSENYNPSPKYLRGLIEKTGFSQRKIAEIIGISPRIMRQYLANRDAKTALDAPYPVQFCIEMLALDS